MTRYGPVAPFASVCDVAALDAGDEGEELLGFVGMLAWSWGCRAAAGIQTVRPFLAASSPGMAKKPTSFEIVGIVLRDVADGEGQHRVVRAFARGDHAHAVVELGRAEVLVEVAGLEHVLLMLEARHRGRRGGVLRLVGGVVGGEVRHGGLHVVEVAEHEQLAGPGVAEGLDHGDLAGGLDLSLLAMNSAQVLGTDSPSSA